MDPRIACIAVTVVGLVATLAATRGDRPRIAWIAKPIASLGFVALALVSGAAGTPYGRAVLVALVLGQARQARPDRVADGTRNPCRIGVGIGQELGDEKWIALGDPV